jgi:multiple sugar transport system permease protein
MNKWNQLRTHLRQHWPSYKARLLGNGGRHGLLYYIVIYFLSITFAFVFVYPIFYMFMISLMSNTDLVDSTILWIPSEVFWNNYRVTIRGLGLDESYYRTVIRLFTAREELIQPFEVELRKLIVFLLIPPFATMVGSLYTKRPEKVLGISLLLVLLILVLPKSYVDSVYVAGTTTMVTVFISALIGYGLARYKFRGKGFFLAMMLLIYILPKTLLFIPRSMLYTDLGIKGTMFALWLPAAVGQGFQATFFILIFFQFFRMIPAQIEESAFLDGATSFNIFIKIAIPTALPAFIIAITYGFAVNWNELFLTNSFLSGNIKTIPMYLQSLQMDWGRYADYSGGADFVNVDFTEAKSFAGTILSIVPLVIMYGIVQRYFIESIDKSGIAGE